MSPRILGTAIFALTIVVVGCSSTAASPRASSAASEAPTAIASASGAALPSVLASSAGGITVEAKAVGAIGMVLVDGKTGLTVYIFTKDVKDNGKSACSGGCLGTWPALTVSAGATPSGGTGVSGKLGTITRDDGTLQVTSTACRSISSRTTRRPATPMAFTRTGKPSSPEATDAASWGDPGAVRPP